MRATIGIAIALPVAAIFCLAYLTMLALEAFRDAARAVWHRRDEVPVLRLPAGKSLAIEGRVPFTLHLGFDGWQRIEDRPAEPGPFGIWSVILTKEELATSGELDFTRRHEGGWENFDHRVALERSEARVMELPRGNPVADESTRAAVAEALP